jgi:hypothetical protein
MSDTPFRERRIPPDEVQRIVKRAADLSLLNPADNERGEALTKAELEQRLADLGISPDVAQRAMEPPPGEVSRGPDGWIRVQRELELDGMLSPDHFEQIAEVIQAAMKMPGRISAVGNKLVWTPSGLASEPSVTVHAKDGVTTIRYVETLANRGQMTIGFGTLASLGGLLGGAVSTSAGVGIAKALEISKSTGAPLVLAIGALMGVATAVGSFVGLRRLVAKRQQTRSAFADELLAHVGAAVNAAMQKTRVKARIETSEETSSAAELEAQEEAEAREKLHRA